MKTKNLIIGAGISGLSYANFCGDYIIVEKENKVGGYCRTIHSNGYVWDYAGHFFHFKTEDIKNMFLKNIDENEVIYQDKCTKILVENDIVDYPFQTNIHQLEKSKFIDCLYDLFNKEEKDEYENFLDMLYGKFGKSIVDMFLKPYNEKLYACDLKDLDKNAMGRFFPYADKQQIINNMKKSKDVSYNNSFLYPVKGAETFINVLYNNLDKNKILMETEIISIDRKRKIAITNTGIEIEYDNLINTIPLNHFTKLLNDKKSNSLNEKLSYNQVLVFNLGFDKKSKFNTEHWLYFPDKQINFYRAGFYDNILNSNKLSMYIEIGYDKKAIIDKDEIDIQLNKTLESLKKVNIIDDSYKLIDYCPIVMNPAYVHINTKTDKEIKNYLNELSNDSIYSIGRYGAWTYCSMEDCIIMAQELNDKLV